VILTLRRLRQEDHRFQASLGYINETLSQKEKKKRKEIMHLTHTCTWKNSFIVKIKGCLIMTKTTL
jgi:hypothetical protein